MKKFSGKEACPCCSTKTFAQCCEPFLQQKEKPTTPEQLMRSRYTAYCLEDFTYIKKTMRAPALKNFNLAEAVSQAKKCKWQNLTVVSARQEENIGFVEFIAQYRFYGKMHELHEKSRFHFLDGQWFYTDGETK